MPVYEPLVVRPVKSGHYPHMAKHDAVIWERFLAQYTPRIAGVAYDVALGGMVIDSALGDEATRLGWQYETALKVDAMVLMERDCWIVEVRPRANVSSVGSALCYVEAAKRDGFTTRPLLPVIVTDSASPDIQFCCAQLGVLLIQVGTAEIPAPVPPDLDSVRTP